MAIIGQRVQVWDGEHEVSGIVVGWDFGSDRLHRMRESVAMAEYQLAESYVDGEVFDVSNSLDRTRFILFRRSRDRGIGYLFSRAVGNVWVMSHTFGCNTGRERVFEPGDIIKTDVCPEWADWVYKAGAVLGIVRGVIGSESGISNAANNLVLPIAFLVFLLVLVAGTDLQIDFSFMALILGL